MWAGIQDAVGRSGDTGWVAAAPGCRLEKCDRDMRESPDVLGLGKGVRLGLEQGETALAKSGGAGLRSDLGKSGLLVSSGLAWSG